MFQSLFSWMNFSKIAESVFPFKAIKVSILVLLDEFLEAFVEERERERESVSILVLLDEFLEDNHFTPQLEERKVSILVLLDEFLEVRAISANGLVARSFNPCSLG